MPLELAGIIGTKVRLRREATGRTQDDVARAARDCGLSWGRSSVAQLEAGTKAVSAAELVLLPLVFRRAFGDDVGLGALLAATSDDAPGELVQLADGAALPWGLVVEVVTGKAPSQWDPALLGSARLPYAEADRAAAGEAREQALALRGELHYRLPLHKLWPIVRDVGDAEQKAGRALGLDPRGVAILAHRRWGHSLVAEREARLGDVEGVDPATVQARRGHVGRKLRAELAEELELARAELARNRARMASNLDRARGESRNEGSTP